LLEKTAFAADFDAGDPGAKAGIVFLLLCGTTEVVPFPKAPVDLGGFLSSERIYGSSIKAS
jgi:hypothetical protein